MKRPEEVQLSREEGEALLRVIALQVLENPRSWAR